MKEYIKIRNIKRYSEKYQPLCNFILKEKIDGANMRFRFTENGIEFGSMENFPIDSKTHPLFAESMEFVKDRIKRPEEWDRFVYFGESVHKHHINYKIPKDMKFIGFDVWDTKTKKWREDYGDIFYELNLPYVFGYKIENHVKQENLNSFIKELDETMKKFESQIDPNISHIEGFVLVDYKSQAFYKHKHKKFSEKKPTVIRAKYPDVTKFFEKYFTNYRIEKTIYKMKDEGKYNKKNPISTLIILLIDDVFSEATPKDIRRTFGKPLHGILGKRIANEFYDKIMELME